MIARGRLTPYQRARRAWWIVRNNCPNLMLGHALLALLLILLGFAGCSVVTRPCSPPCSGGQACIAGVCVATPTPVCPAACPLGTACTDPAKGCEAIPAPGLVCEAGHGDPGEHYGCWHWPGGATSWLYACPVYDEQGGIIGVASVTDPEQCPAKFEPPPPDGCSIDGEPGPPIPDYQPQLRDAVYAAISRALPGCQPQGTCLLGDTTRRQWQAKVIAELRAAGLCAGEHVPGVTDEIAVATSPTAPREGWHVFAGDDGDGPVPPGSARRTVAWKHTGAYAAPGPSPPPPPAGDGCGEPAPPAAARINVKIHKANCANLDSTILVSGAAYCASVGFPDRLECPVRQEAVADRAACEARLRGPVQTWTCQGTGCQVYPCAVVGNCACAGTVNTNPSQAIVLGAGKVTTCTSDGKACGSVVVQ